MDLTKVRGKISMQDVSLKEYAEFLETFDGKTLVIETESKDVGTLNVKLSKDQFAHMIGLDYCYDTVRNKNSYKGNDGIGTLKSEGITISTLRKNFNNNRKNATDDLKISWYFNILPRFEWLPFFLNKISSNKCSLFENKGIKTKMNGNYLLFKGAYETYLILSIVEAGLSFRCESFICNDGLYYCNPETDIPIKNIYIK